MVTWQKHITDKKNRLRKRLRKKFLYHGTPSTNALGIILNGLYPNKRRNFKSSKAGCLYLSENKDIAIAVAIYACVKKGENFVTIFLINGQPLIPKLDIDPEENRNTNNWIYPEQLPSEALHGREEYSFTGDWTKGQKVFITSTSPDKDTDDMIMVPRQQSLSKRLLLIR